MLVLVLILMVGLQAVGGWLMLLLADYGYVSSSPAWVPYGFIVAGLLQPLGIATWTALNRHAINEQSFRRFTAAYLAASIMAVVPLFAVVYYSEAHTARGCFNETHISRPDAIYFTMATFTTTGYGDIHPTSTPCRTVASMQMGVDLFLFAFVVSWSVGRALTTPDPEPDA